MTITNITPLPIPVPTRADPANFAVRADAFLASLPTFGDQLNTFASEANALAVEVQNNKDLSDQTYLDMQELENTMVDIYNNSSATSNFKGLWSSLTGALVKPASVYHNTYYWVLLNDLTDVTTSIPSTSNTDWLQVIYSSDLVAYTPSTSTLNATTVQQAIDQSFHYTNSVRLENLLLNDRFAINQEPVPPNGVTAVTGGASNKYVADQWYVRCTGGNLSVNAYENIPSPRLAISASTVGVTSIVLGQRMEYLRTAQIVRNTVQTPELNFYIRGAFPVNRVITWTLKEPSSAIPDDFSTTTLIASGSFTTQATYTPDQEYYIPIPYVTYLPYGLQFEIELGALEIYNEVQIKAIQLVPVPRGSSIIRVEYKPRDYVLDLLSCQRYFQKFNTIVNNGTTSSSMLLPTPMRITPTVTGGGVGFVVSNSTNRILHCYQTTRAFQTLTLNARL